MPSATPLVNPPMTSSTAENCHFLRLPAEIRNDIYRYALVDSKIVDARYQWPGITAANREIRNDCLPVFLGNNSFSIPIMNCNRRHFDSWLAALEGLPVELRRLIKSITVQCLGGLLPTQRFPLVPFQRFPPNFDFWNDMITRLLRAGLSDDFQIHFPGLSIETTKPQQSVIEVIHFWLFNKYVLRPLLLRHDLGYHSWVPQSPSKEARSWFVKYEKKQGYTLQEVHARMLGSAVGDPSEWFDDWERQVGARL